MVPLNTFWGGAVNKPPNEVLFIGIWEALKISLSGENLWSGGPGDVAFLIFVSLSGLFLSPGTDAYIG